MPAITMHLKPRLQFSSTKRIYLDGRMGLCNRLETFAFACAIQRAFGHEIVLGWPELDALQVAGTRRGRPGFWGRRGAVRLRQCSEEEFPRLSPWRQILLRGFGGPKERMAAVYHEAASRLSLEESVAAAVKQVFREIGPRPVIGIHLRQGDFLSGDEAVYDLRRFAFKAVPVWWHEWIMDRIVRVQPDVCFLLCHNGQETSVATLKRNFDLKEVPLANPYANRASRFHRARTHPVADLFALACCPVVLATPVSSYSHYAVNVLGGNKLCLMPPSPMVKTAPKAVRVCVQGRLLQDWVDAALLGLACQPLPQSLAGIDFDQTARCDWLDPGLRANPSPLEERSATPPETAVCNPGDRAAQ